MDLPPSSAELAAWLRLTLEPGLGPAQARSLLAAVGLPQDIYALSAAALRRYLPPELAAQLSRPPDDATSQRIARTLAWLEQPDCHLLTLADPAYPTALLDIHDPPLLLYARGHISLLQRQVLSIVGARRATPAGCDNAQSFARHLAQLGWCIASGLALGIDAAAHQGALQAGPESGGTIAVMATGIDVVYPSAHLELARRIAAQGLLITEYPLGTPSQPHQFPRRNRIVAGLARGVLVVEAARQSGSLITARLAAETGREVFAIPGSIHSPLSRGCHALIRQGAKLVESAQDIHDELGTPDHRSVVPKARADTAPPPALASGAAALLAALGHDPTDTDTLLARCGQPAGDLLAHLTELELQGLVSRLPDGRWQQRPHTETPSP